MFTNYAQTAKKRPQFPMVFTEVTGWLEADEFLDFFLEKWPSLSVYWKSREKHFSDFKEVVLRCVTRRPLFSQLS